MHFHSIMHDLLHLSHYIIAPMHQCMIIFKCVVMILKQNKNPNKYKKDKNKTKEGNRN